MDCQRTEQLLSHYFDGELPSDDRARVTFIGLRDVEELSKLVAALDYENTPHTSKLSNPC